MNLLGLLGWVTIFPHMNNIFSCGVLRYNPSQTDDYITADVVPPQCVSTHLNAADFDSHLLITS